MGNTVLSGNMRERRKCSFAIGSFVPVLSLILFSAVAAHAQSVSGIAAYEGRPIAGIEISFEASPPDPAAEAEYTTAIRRVIGSDYSEVRVRGTLQALYDTSTVASVRVEARETAKVQPTPGNGGVPLTLRYFIRRQLLVGEITLNLLPTTTSPISSDELRARLNMLQPGGRLTEIALRRSADDIQTYLRDRGFYNGDVSYAQQPDSSGTRAAVTFNIKLGQQARVSAFKIDIKGFDQSRLMPTLTARQGQPFTQQNLAADVNRIRQAIIGMGYLAPQLNDPRVERDASTDTVNLTLTGGVGPKVQVLVKDYTIRQRNARDLLPVLREGSIDLSAIVEGQRRLENSLQQKGYFFATAPPVCTVTPPVAPVAVSPEESCDNLNAAELSGHAVAITYNVDRGRKFKLTDIRIEGTNKISYAEIGSQLRTQKATVLGFIPLLGYGRGYTSRDLLEQDRRTVTAEMADRGYRRAKVDVRQGVSLNGEDLIITFVVSEGVLTRIAGVEVRGNEIYTEGTLRDQLKAAVLGSPFSRSQARLDGDNILNLYAHNGYVDAQLDFSIVELPKKNNEEQVRLVYTMRNEGDKVFVNRIILNGLRKTKREAVLRSIPLTEGDVLRADKITESESTLYGTDAFRQVVITTRPAGINASGFRTRDVIIDVEEQKPRILSYGGGYSTDNGPLGFVDLRNINLFGKLRQGAVRIRASARQELARFEYLDPRFKRYGLRQFAPLSFSVQYERDSTVTRFFRSTIDTGTMGIVQRLDDKGNPIDIVCDPVTGVCKQVRTGAPTVARFTVNLETQRVLQEKTRSILFARYTYEDARLFNINSLVIADILRPDHVVRSSRFGVSFVRDTREQCSDDPSLRSLTSLPTSRQPCKYNQFDATRGDNLTADYAIALRQLGGNISFSRFLASYRRYYQVKALRSAVLAGNLTVGLSKIINPRDRNGDGVIDETDLALPISERFFAGGSTTLRGFGYQEAGPRLVVRPQGVFRDAKNKPVFLNPFTVPIGGNAMVVANLEARIPLTSLFQAVPFYDGGNVFRRVSDIFGRGAKPGEDPNLRARWSHTVGLGFRVKTPIGGAIAIDYGLLLNPPEFIISPGAPPSVFRLKRTQIHFRFSQTF